MRRQKTEYTGYVSKAGKNAWYKIKARSKDKKRVLLQSIGNKPIEFWVDTEKLCRVPKPERREGEELRQCWECGCSFTRREAIYNDGEWGDSYCGC